jgi:flagellar hook-basal body complex protein FliE
MTIEAIAALSGTFSLQPTGAASLVSNANSASPGVFDAVVRSLDSLNTQMATNQQAVQTLATGETEDLHRLMMNLESTRLSFQLALQVRNKTLEAYQELMRMQI